jgi:hypothetical protein
MPHITNKLASSLFAMAKIATTIIATQQTNNRLHRLNAAPSHSFFTHFALAEDKDKKDTSKAGPSASPQPKPANTERRKDKYGVRAINLDEEKKIGKKELRREQKVGAEAYKKSIETATQLLRKDVLKEANAGKLTEKKGNQKLIELNRANRDAEIAKKRAKKRAKEKAATKQSKSSVASRTRKNPKKTSSSETPSYIN